MSAASLLLCGVLGGLAALVAGTLGSHSGFEPVSQVRESAPMLAVLAGAGYAHAVARVRAERDAALEVDRTGRALFLGVAMLSVTALAWLAFAQSLPALYTAALGTEAATTLTVVRRVSVDPTSAECANRLEVQGAALPRVIDLCVDAALWNAVVPGQMVQADVRRSALGVETLRLRPLAAAS